MAAVNLTPAPVNTGGDQIEAEVTIDDQKQINRFARLNCKEEELDLVLNSIKRQLDNVKEANDELMLADDDDDLDGDLGDSSVAKDLSNIHFRVGESFISVNKDEAEQLLENKRKELEAEIKEMETQIQPMKEQMLNIKAHLYAKFGNNINLPLDDWVY